MASRSSIWIQRSGQKRELGVKMSARAVIQHRRASLFPQKALSPLRDTIYFPGTPASAPLGPHHLQSRTSKGLLEASNATRPLLPLQLEAPHVREHPHLHQRLLSSTSAPVPRLHLEALSCRSRCRAPPAAALRAPEGSPPHAPPAPPACPPPPPAPPSSRA